MGICNCKWDKENVHFGKRVLLSCMLDIFKEMGVTKQELAK